MQGTLKYADRFAAIISRILGMFGFEGRPSRGGLVLRDLSPPFEAVFLPTSHADTTEMLSAMVNVGEKARPLRGRKASIKGQLAVLASEFNGQPFVLFYHAGLISHLRRNIDIESNWPRFQRLWLEHADFLLKHLNSRWLVSACETISDHSTDAAERAGALCGVIFMGTIKLYETERVLCGPYSRTLKDYIPSKEIIPLFDGLTAFNVSQGDMIKNLLRRIHSPFPKELIAPRIMQELVQRSRSNDTVFKRLADVHTKAASAW